MNKVTQVYFSPSGTTEQVSRCFAAELGQDAQKMDLLRQPLKEARNFGADEFVAVSVPVFSGRIPRGCREMLLNLKGSGTPAAAIAVYGNRDYDDALLELCDLLREQGFVVVGAAAFVAHHSLFTAVAEGRPDAQDLAQVKQFAQACKAKVDSGEVAPLQAEIKGNRPYKPHPERSMHPSGDDSCVRCGVCVRICPVGAIGADDPRVTKDGCIACTACIANCPHGARAFRGEAYETAHKGFAEKNAQRKEPELFV